MEPRFVPLPEPGDRTVHHTEWAGEARAAVGCAGLLLALSLAVDAGNQGLALPSTMLWIVLSVVLFAILLPDRVVASPGRVTVQGLWSRRTVYTDRLSAVRWPEGIEQRLVLTDTDGSRAQIQLRVLLANPSLWLLLEADARASRTNGTLREGVRDLDRLAHRVDRDTTHSVFTVSGLR
ncbi:hypothetical protein [Streptomyces sp. NBC_00572]|uniref:hypothetical protein n=1 Tax=Streptomyces sp. NBC_00572 TaxID=2903664 RepID=UPI002257D28A|nr:hypothetical protein [Streptomyces sp. NBC_00572]MCX4986607.1 hypothetical protein [Streptomyces sp. NBC_00572]